MNIGKGYNVIIDSWENDLDAPNSTVTVCSSYRLAKFTVEFAKLFTSDQFGNLLHDDEQNWDELVPIVRELILKNNLEHEVIYAYPEDPSQSFTFKDVLEDKEAAQDYINGLHCELFGSSEYFGWRVFEKSEVYYFSEAPTSIEELNTRR